WQRAMTGLLSSFSAVSEALSSFQSTPRCQGNFTVLGKNTRTSDFKRRADHGNSNDLLPILW
ncbi:MAG TPA: hypothetical protein VN207_11830, partial [Ktedonobacteraceae bacterium]|nr:hypothetical protein [Ktedonobacteraceae bacterium]